MGRLLGSDVNIKHPSFGEDDTRFVVFLLGRMNLILHGLNWTLNGISIFLCNFCLDSEKVSGGWGGGGCFSGKMLIEFGDFGMKSEKEECV